MTCTNRSSSWTRHAVVSTGSTDISPQPFPDAAPQRRVAVIAGRGKDQPNGATVFSHADCAGHFFAVNHADSWGRDGADSPQGHLLELQPRHGEAQPGRIEGRLPSAPERCDD